MKSYKSVILLVLLAAMMLMVLSCSKESKPTIPNFEEDSATLWDYNNSLWFNLDYDYARLGSARAFITLSAKGVDPTTTLKINGQPITFEITTNYTEGKVYDGAYIDLNTTQPVNYEIVNLNGKTYSGIVTLPDEVTGNFPDFVPTNNYPASWAYAGTTSPDIQTITAYASNEALQQNSFTREIAGILRDYTLNKSMWESLGPLSQFKFQVNAIVYKRAHGDKVLTIGSSNDYKSWSNVPDETSAKPKMDMNQTLKLIQKDIAK